MYFKSLVLDKKAARSMQLHIISGESSDGVAKLFKRSIVIVSLLFRYPHQEYHAAVSLGKHLTLIS